MSDLIIALIDVDSSQDYIRIDPLVVLVAELQGRAIEEHAKG